MNSIDIQRKRKQEQNEYYNLNPHKRETAVLGEMDKFWLGLVLFCVIFIGGLLTLGAVTENDSRNDCEKIGGDYKIVDRTFAGKSAVDVYGCVK